MHANTGERLALKLMLARSLLTPELVERFRREARITSSIRDDHVVRVLDADVARELDDVPFLVMELLIGRDFERVCLERAPSPLEAVDWMRQLAGALDKAHREGIVHRDLKPENVFLAEREGGTPIVKILDFGVAKIVSEAEGQATATGQILGTPRYMAPEQAVDSKQISSASDRFALGRDRVPAPVRATLLYRGELGPLAQGPWRAGPQERPSAKGSHPWSGVRHLVRTRLLRSSRAIVSRPASSRWRPSRGRSLRACRRRAAHRRRTRRWIAAAGLAACGLTATVWGIGHRRTPPNEAAPVAVRLAAEPTTTAGPGPLAPAPPPRVSGTRGAGRAGRPPPSPSTVRNYPDGRTSRASCATTRGPRTRGRGKPRFAEGELRVGQDLGRALRPAATNRPQ